jgi:Endonuclease/Exonuclease/phosphatase family
VCLVFTVIPWLFVYFTFAWGFLLIVSLRVWLVCMLLAAVTAPSLLSTSLPVKKKAHLPVSLGSNQHVQLRLGKASHSPTIKVATYNVQDFFDANSSLTPAGKAKSPESLNALAAVLSRLNADVVMLQEVQTLRSLQQFLQKTLNPLQQKQGKPPYNVLISLGSNRSEEDVRQAVLYREPLQHVAEDSFYGLRKTAL